MHWNSWYSCFYPFDASSKLSEISSTAEALSTRNHLNILLAQGSFHYYLLESNNNQSRKYEYDMSTNVTLKWGTRKKGKQHECFNPNRKHSRQSTHFKISIFVCLLCVVLFHVFFSSLQRLNDARHRTMCLFFFTSLGLLCCLFILFRMVQIGWNVLTIVDILGVRLFA